MMKFGLILVGILFGAVTTFGAAQLDPAFGNGGKVHINFGGAGQADFASALVIQPDGKIVAAGRTYQSSLDLNSSNFVVVRIESSGNLDFSFGFFGTRTTDFDGNRDEATTIALQSDGKILVGGFRDTNVSSRFSFAIARYTSDGNLDPAFGSNGKVTTDFGERGARIGKLLVLPSGKIAALGSNQGNDLTDRAVMAVYNSNGSLDTSFGSGGKMILGFGGASYLGSAALQADGKLVVSLGAVFQPCGSANCTTLVPILMRFNQTLTPDRKFGRRQGREYGAAGTEFGSPGGFSTVLVEANGSIIGGGNQMARYYSTGNFASFLTPVGYPVFGLSQKFDGKFVACGSVTQTATLKDIRLSLLDSDGNTIGSGVTDVFGNDDECSAVAVQPDGKILVAGSTKVDESGNFYDFLVLRYNSITQ
ncbi:MAG: hypothetical protein KIS76_11700 [Pyrinomonadaceae bacterium]|nr:hypothetical protein [Pyrinomonadaceae bacterium]